MNKRIPFILGLLLTAMALWLLVTPSRYFHQLMDSLDNLGYDLQLKTRALTEKIKPSPSIAIVDIDDKSLQKEGQWPWTRNKLAELIFQLKNQNAAVIAFDMFFAEKEENIAEALLQQLAKKKLMQPEFVKVLKDNIKNFDEDNLFAKQLNESATVLAFSFLPRKEIHNFLPPPLLKLSKADSEQLQIIKAAGYISNIPILQQAAKTAGFINIYPDNDGIIRHAPLVLAYQDQLYGSLALQAVLTLLDDKVSLFTPQYGKTRQLEGIQLGNVIIPTDAKGQVIIPFIGRSYTFPYHSATDVMHNRLPKDALLGKIVFIGTSATGLGDLKATAIQNPFPGVEIQATLANGLLTNHFSYKPAWTFGANVFLTFILGLLAALLLPYFGPRTLAAIIIIFPIAILFINNWIWKSSGLILSVLVPVILVLIIAFMNLIYGYLFESRRRERLREMFGQYVPEQHIDAMLKTTTSYALGGEDRQMTVLFADIRNFTEIAEGLSAKELVELLNTFFTPMTEIIFKHQGTIDKYVGDLIMAFWGAPLEDKQHTLHAIQSALGMQSRLKSMQNEFAAKGWPEIKIGIGVSSGIMSVGDMGSRFRRNYTVLGDPVNLASRIEALTKYYSVDIIVAEKTAREQQHFIFRKLDRVRVKGKKIALEIDEVICEQAQLTEALSQELDAYHAALEDYFHQRWDEAYEVMERLAERYPETKLYQLYLKRISIFKKDPPPADWDGVFVHHSK